MSNNLDRLAATWLRHTSIPFVIFALLTLALYASALSHGVIFDDVLFVVLQKAANQWHFSFSPRALTEATIIETTKIVGMDLHWQRLENLILHMLNMVVIFVFSKQIYSWVRQKDENDAETLLCSLLATLLFLVHPVTVYGVAYLNQRSTEMASFFSILTLMVFWSGLRNNSLPRLLAAVPAYLLTLLGKEHAIMLPLICATLAVVHDGGIRKQRILQLIPVGLGFVATLYLVVFKENPRDIIGQAPEHSADFLVKNYVQFYPGFDPTKVLWYSAQTQASLFFKYWQLWILPNPQQMSIDMRPAFATSMWSSFTVGTIFYIAYGLAATLMLFLGKTRLQRFIAFSLLAPWILFWTEFASLRVQEIFVLYRAYLWFILLVPALALALGGLKPSVRYSLIAVLFVAFTIISIERIATLRSEVTAWRDALLAVKDVKDKRPGIERIYFNLGTGYLNSKQYPQAIQALLTSLDYVPTAYLRPHTLINLAISYELSGQYEKAATRYVELTQLEPEAPGAWLSVGNIMTKIGKPDSARIAYQRACALHAEDACEKLKNPGTLIDDEEDSDDSDDETSN